MIEIIPNYHPMLVHFTVALTVISFITLLLSRLVNDGLYAKELDIVSRWCLWLGAVFVIFTVVAGFHAYYTVAHDGISHAVMNTHRNWAIVTSLSILALATWRYIGWRKKKGITTCFIIAHLVVVSLVMITGWYGAELVYRHGTGVMRIPDTSAPHEHAGTYDVDSHQSTPSKSVDNSKKENDKGEADSASGHHDHGTHPH